MDETMGTLLILREGSSGRGTRECAGARSSGGVSRASGAVSRRGGLRQGLWCMRVIARRSVVGGNHCEPFHVAGKGPFADSITKQRRASCSVG